MTSLYFRRSRFEQPHICILAGSYYVSFNFFSPIVLVRVFKLFNHIFSISSLSPHWSWLFLCTYLNPFHTKVACINFDWTWPSELEMKRRHTNGRMDSRQKWSKYIIWGLAQMRQNVKNWHIHSWLKKDYKNSFDHIWWAQNCSKII